MYLLVGLGWFGSLDAADELVGWFICLDYVLLWELFFVCLFMLLENEKCHSLACQLLKLKSTRGKCGDFYYMYACDLEDVNDELVIFGFLGAIWKVVFIYFLASLGMMGK